MKLNEALGTKVIRNKPFVHPNGVEDYSYLGEVLKLVGIKDNGKFLFERYDVVMHEIHRYLKKPVPKEGYVFLELKQTWDDGKWRLAKEDEEEESRAHNLARNVSAVSKSMKS